MSESWFRYIVVGLLGAIVLLQLLMIYRLPTPISYKSILAAPQDRQVDLVQQIPLVQVFGSVNVDER